MIADNKFVSVGNAPKEPNESNILANLAEDGPEPCSGRLIPHWKVFLDNLPYAVMILLGSAIFNLGFASELWRWSLAGAYLAYGVAGAFWIMVFVCPYCHFYNTRLCPCGYGIIAAKFRAKKDGADFARQFKKHIPAIVPLWFIPLIVGVILLWAEFSWILLCLLLAFAVNAYAILPLVSRQYGCASCPQKDTCPWMGCGK